MTNMETLRPGKRWIAFAASVLITTSIFFTSPIFAHNIDLDKSWEVAREYARLVRRESDGKWLHYSTNCVEAFPGHNHYVRCAIGYQNAKDTKARVISCRETIEVYYAAHKGSAEDYRMYYKSTSASTCGRRPMQMVPRSELNL